MWNNNRVIFHHIFLPVFIALSPSLPPSPSLSVSSIFASSPIYTSVQRFNLVGTGGQISSAGSRRDFNSRTVQFNWKKVNSRCQYQRAITGRTLARAKQCVISQRRTVCRARLPRMSPCYRFYNQGGGSEPRVPVSPPAKLFTTPRELKSRGVRDSPVVVGT